MLHPHRRDKKSLLSHFPSGRFTPVRNAGCEHVSHCSALFGDTPVPTTHHRASSFTPAGVHCTFDSASWTTDVLRLVKNYLNFSSQSRSCSRMKMCEGSLHDLPPVSQQAWQGREPAHWLWAPIPLFETPKAKLRMNKFAQETHIWKVILTIFTLMSYPNPTIPSQSHESKEAKIMTNFNKF